MVNRLVILLIMSVLSVSVFLTACALAVPEQTPANGTQPGALARTDRQPLQTLEKDVYQVWGKGFYSTHPERKESQTLVFNLEAGNAVEGEVTVGDVSSRKVMAFVTDPNGNVTVKTDTIVVDEDFGFLESTQEYPWKFTFTANATGAYTLEMNTDWAYVEKPVMAHVKVMIYPD